VAGEVRGLLKNPETWSELSLPSISFGQEVGVTALQIVNAYSSMANGGVLIQPRIVKEIKNPSGEVVYKCERNIIRRVVDPEIALNIMQILEGLVEKGTGQMAQVSGYSVAGKTGTAQKIDRNTRKYSSANYIASFCGVIPSSKPRLTILVILDEPKSDYWASSTAAPVFSQIAARAVAYLKIPPDKKPLHLADARGMSY
jgi:cell division protein FtsI (penicillin-binding protein 3)